MTDQMTPAQKSYDRIAYGLLMAQILSVTFFQKFAIIVGGSQIFLGMLLFLGATAFGFLSGRMHVRKENLAFFMVLVGVLALTQVLGGEQFAIMSFLLMIIIHIPYVFQIKDDLLERKTQFMIFQKCMAIIAGLAIFQYFGQYIFGTTLMYPIDTIFPQGIVAQGFHGLNALSYEGSIYKATGMVFLEPAILCQFLAISLIIETIYFKDWRRIVLLLAGIIVTFSGTGLIIILVLFPIYLIQNRRFITLLAMFIALVSAPLWAPIVGLEKTVERATEFNDLNSSGYARFLSIFPTLETYVLSENDTLFFGRGAGSSFRLFNERSLDYAAHNPSWGRMILEYGSIGGLAYFLFLGYIFWRARTSAYVKAALLIQFMLLGEYVLVPTVHALILALLVWPPQDSEPLTEDRVEEPLPLVTS